MVGVIFAIIAIACGVAAIHINMRANREYREAMEEFERDFDTYVAGEK